MNVSALPARMVAPVWMNLLLTYTHVNVYLVLKVLIVLVVSAFCLLNAYGMIPQLYQMQNQTILFNKPESQLYTKDLLVPVVFCVYMKKNEWMGL